VLACFYGGGQATTTDDGDDGQREPPIELNEISPPSLRQLERQERRTTSPISAERDSPLGARLAPSWPRDEEENILVVEVEEDIEMALHCLQLEHPAPSILSQSISIASSN